MKLLALQAHIEQLIAEAESLTVDPNGDDETLPRVKTTHGVAERAGGGGEETDV